MGTRTGDWQRVAYVGAFDRQEAASDAANCGWGTAQPMAFYDIFNGDADGICALHQLRLAQPRDSLLITGVKRDIALVKHVQAQPGDEITVLDISLSVNRSALIDALEAGARCLYFDHHLATDIPAHPHLEAHIESAADICTSLIVNAYLEAPFPEWAAVAAFGDNLPRQAVQVTASLALTYDQLSLLRELGEGMNYNAYADSPEDMHFHPADLYRRLRPYSEPRDFAMRDAAFEVLRESYQDDLRQASQVPPLLDTPTHYLVILPDTRWARRVNGVLANRLAESHPGRAHAVLIRRSTTFRVSVRAPVDRPTGAAALCGLFVSGGGRSGAAGINALPVTELHNFQRAFEAAFRPPPTRP